MPKARAIIVSGPTASGKSRLAIELALELRRRGRAAEIISADSAQVYRFMDIGTDKLRPEEREGIPHHLIDVVKPDEHFDAAIFRRLALEQIERICRENGIAVLVGGTGFWIRVLLFGLFAGPGRDEEIRAELKKLSRAKGPAYLHELLCELDPESARRIHPNDLNRLVRALEIHRLTGKSMSEHFQSQAKEQSIDALHLALKLERGLLYERINERVEQMMSKGFLEEVQNLRQMGYGSNLASQKIIGYRQLHQHLDGELELGQAVHEIKKATRHYARRQLVWLRGQPGILWFDAFKERARILDIAVRFMEESK